MRCESPSSKNLNLSAGAHFPLNFNHNDPLICLQQRCTRTSTPQAMVQMWRKMYAVQEQLANGTADGMLHIGYVLCSEVSTAS